MHTLPQRPSSLRVSRATLGVTWALLATPAYLFPSSATLEARPQSLLVRPRRSFSFARVTRSETDVTSCEARRSFSFAHVTRSEADVTFSFGHDARSDGGAGYSSL